MLKYYKLIDGQLVVAPSTFTVDGYLISNPTEAQYLVSGWKPLFIAEKPTTTQYYNLEPVYANSIDKIFQTWVEVLNSNIDWIKRVKIRELKKYESSSDVNSFSINGSNMWLNKADRTALMYSINSEEALGLITTTIYTTTVPSIPLEMPVNTAKSFLQEIEVYAKNSYGITQTHQNNIMACTTVLDIINYDFTLNYPSKLSLTI